MSRPRRRIILTVTDFERLQHMLETQGGVRNAEQVELLESELAEAELTSPESVPPNVVTMNSTVIYEDETGARRQVTLTYPQAARSDEGCVSVLAPIGSALIGLSEGQTIEWPVPSGRTKRIRILAVPYQPEAQGHFHL